MRITTLPVYSRLAEDSAIPAEIRSRLPSGWHLSRHQVETYEALTGDQYDVVINTAMTGDGKSLAAQLPTLANGEPLLMMYPTNELVRDQERQARQTLHQWRRGDQISVSPMTGELLDQIVATGVFRQKAGAIKRLAGNNEVLLTNPDIFHYIAQFFYTRRDDAPDSLFGRILELFNVLTFDEFHVFQAPQIVSVLNALLLMREITGSVQPKKFLFLSATPGGLLAEYLRRAGFRVKVIDPASNDGYLHTEGMPDLERWRPVIRRSEICFWTGRAEDWVEAYLEDTVLAFFQAHGPGAKGAIIVNSVATAYRLVSKLQPVFARRGLTVLPNTGLTGSEVRQASREADLLIGTSTVDVGVDFRINFLVFESLDAGTFLQRLGRLGRHNDDGHGHPFHAFEAHALVPNYLYERLFLGRRAEPALLSGDTSITREQLGEAIRSAYPSANEFRPYAREWGWVQSAHVYRELCNPTVRDSYGSVREQLKGQYWRTFGVSIGQKLQDYKELRTGARQVVEEAQSFRGGSPFDCGVIDETSMQSGDRPQAGPSSVKTYGLMTLAANAELAWLDREAFERIARERNAPLSATRLDGLAGWFRFRGFLPERRNIRVLLADDTAAWGAERFGTVQVIDGLTLEVPEVDWINDLNRHLRPRKFVALLCLCDREKLVYQLRLPPMFEIFPFVDRSGRGLGGSIAFARHALMLHVAIMERGFACGGDAMIF